MAGVVLRFNDEWTVERMLRDDVLASLYGKSAANPKRLIDEALQLLLRIAEAGDIDAMQGISAPIMGLFPGHARVTDAISSGDALRQAVLLHSSLSRLDCWDDLDEDDVPPAEEVNKRFATEVREAVCLANPQLAANFGKSALLIPNGRPVKFGYLSGQAVLHFSVLHPSRQPSSVRAARARLWELSRAKVTGSITHAALVTAVPRADDPTLGEKQHESISGIRVEIEREADAVDMRFLSVTSVQEAANRVLELVG